MYLNGPNDMSRSIDKAILAQSDSTSNSGKVTNNSTSWWSDEEYRLFNVWASSYEKQNAAFANPYFDYFFTGQDIQVSLYGLENPNDALPVYSLAYNIEQQKMPLYGFWDYTYSAMLRGTRIISGAFSIVAMYPHLLTKAIAKASFNISKGEKSSATNWKAIRTLNEDERNITKFWRRNFDYNLDLDQQHLFSVHPPFHLIIKYGIQSTSLSEYSGAIPYMPSSRGSQSRIAELEKDFRYAANGYMLTDVNERLVRDSSEITTKIALENVEIMSKSISYGVDGEPIMETYTFLARDERIINDNTDRSYSDSSLIYNPTVDAPDIYGRLSSAGGSANITS